MRRGVCVRALSGCGLAALAVWSLFVAPFAQTLRAATTSTCSVALSGASLYVGSGEADWTLNVSAASTCAWSAASDQPWLVVKSTAPTPGIGTGSIKLRANANTSSPSKRTGHVVVDGVIYTVTQEGCGSSCSGTTTITTTSSSTCSLTLSGASIYVGDGEANWTLNVSAASTCAWSASSDQAWLLVRSTTPAPGFGAGSIKLRADANTTSSAKRTGHVMVNGVTYTVSQGGCGSTCTGSGTGSTTTTTTGTTLRVLQWNTHHGGVGTDGVWSPSRLVSYIASYKPDVISLNEMEYKDSYTGGTDEPATIAALLKQATGKTWYYKFAVGSGASAGIGNMLLSSIPFDAVSTHLLAADRVIINGSITVNGRSVNLFSTHLDDASTTTRLGEIADLEKWGTGFVEQRIMCGDFNAWPGSTENATMTQTYTDSWAQAQANGTAIAYAGNTAGNTRNSRIDYIYYSHGATHLKLVSSQVFDTRDANGIMPSDHRPVLSIFTVQ